MAQKTTLVPSGIPGQVYGSFAGKAIFTAIVIVATGTIYMSNSEGTVKVSNSEGSTKG